MNCIRISKQKIWKLLILCAVIILYFINLYSEFNIILKWINIVVLVIINLALVAKAKNSKLLQILFLLLMYFNYSFLISLYIFPSEFNSDYMYFANSDLSLIGLGIMNVFFASIYLSFPDFKKDRNILSLAFKHNNILISGVLGAILVLIALNGSLVSEDTARGNLSPIFEYAIILFILALYYSNKSKYLRLIIVIIGGVFIVREILTGGRIIALQFILAIYIFYLSERLTLKKTIGLGLIGLVFSNLIGIFRNSVRFSISLLNFDNISFSVNKLLDGYLTLDTSYSAYHTSLTFIAMVRDYNIGWDVRINKLFRFIHASLIGGTGDVSIQRYTYPYYFHSFGGYFPFHIWFYLGIFGVVMSGFVIGRLIEFSSSVTLNQNQNKYGLLSCIYIYLIVRVPRWYMYDLSVMTRGILFLVIGYYALYRVDIIIKKRLSYKV